MRQQSSSSKAKPARGTTAINAIVSGLAKEIRSSSTVDTNRVCSNRGSRKNKCSNGTPESVGKVCTMQPICYGSGL